jgi:multicomponent Na+:H+ antiporter subunit G
VRDAVVAGLLFGGVGLLLLSCLGVLVFDGIYDRLHFTGPAGLGAAAVAAAVLVRESFSLIGNKALFLGAFMLLTSPLLVHATARAARVREHGQWAPQPSERVEVEAP